MAKRPWLGGLSTHLVMGARAYAAVGAPTAARWKPSDGNYDDALASIVKTADSGLIPWQHPSSSELISTVPFSEAGLAKGWNDAFHGDASASNPVARLTVDTQSLEN